MHRYVAAAAVCCLTYASLAADHDAVCKSAAGVSADLAAHRVTSQALVAGYTARIARLNPEIHAVIGLNPRAMAAARAADARRSAGKARGPLDGLPILVKDNIGIAGLPATAGSLALAANVRAVSSPVVANLTRAGAVILGRTNLSEWANIRSEHSASGWSAVGGLTRNPYMLDRSACGSSSGSAAAVAAGMAAAAIGTETDGSISCPASMNGLAGLKPTVGLVSRAGIVPISHTQDTAGPITHTVRDAAMLLTAMAGSDPADPASADADAHRVFERALAVLKARGATLVAVDDYDMKKLGRNEGLVLRTELKADLDAYLAGSPPAVKARTLAQLIAFDDAHPREMTWFGQGFFVKAQRTPGLQDPAYIKARATNLRLAGPDGIDRLLREHHVVALISPAQNPASVIDLVNGDAGIGAGDSELPAIAAYPYITVPMGEVHGPPVGLSFIGPKWSEARLIGLAFAYEQASHVSDRNMPGIRIVGDGVMRALSGGRLDLTLAVKYGEVMPIYEVCSILW